MLVKMLTDDFPEAEFAIPGQIVADIGFERPPTRNYDGSFTVHIEAPTITK